MNDHDEDATAEQLPGRERRRLQTSRLVQYLLLQAVIAGACVLALLQSLPGPPAQYQVTAFQLTEAGVERAVTLPYFSPLRNAMNDPPRFTGQFVRPAGEAARAWSVFLPRFTNGVEVTVNDVVILDSRRDPAANRPDRNTPADCGDPGVGAARRRQRDFNPAVHLGPDHRLPRSHLGWPGRIAAPDL